MHGWFDDKNAVIKIQLHNRFAAIFLCSQVFGTISIILLSYSSESLLVREQLRMNADKAYIDRRTENEWLKTL